jgi:hypothetical protein
MSSHLLLSLTAFSLAFSSSIFAKQFIVSNELSQEGKGQEEEAQIKEAKGDSKSNEAAEIRHVAISQKDSKETTAQESAATPPEQKKVKPHYAGVRKPQSKSPAKKKSSKIKNQWFTSKTHPKVEKKGGSNKEIIETSNEIPEDRPFYVRNKELLAFNSERSFIANDDSQGTAPKELNEGHSYPQAGFQAPDGHVYLTAEYLLWRTRQEGMEFATAKQVHFEYDSGFRVGLGVHLPHDGWDIYVNYTNFHPTKSQGAHGSLYPLFLFQGTGVQGSSISNAHAHWKIEFQDVDVEIGRAYSIAKTLIFRPFFGLKGAWIDQHANIHYSGGYIPAGQTFRTHFKNNFKGAGPLVGIESNWQLGFGLSFFGDLAAALVVGHFDNEQEQHQNGGAQVVELEEGFNLVSPFLQTVAGIAWDRNFNNDKCHFGLSAGFEAQYWWSQNQTELFTDKDFPIYARQKGNLAFYGLTLRGRFDF